ncbi:energy transducer TonB [Litoribrevibacter albus]|uniref:Cell envelope biogenesis protein TonB n=1 Tax=Litoribrevibacter albus TaxID=1473156 RepID=A0AA37W4X1_9GAMM|nr:energy transducer TonB [Litoribrevibacter albus]GLQ30567.1 cell envelope biogenesis protein TonB [Litoribrevibacter albus]
MHAGSLNSNGLPSDHSTNNQPQTPQQITPKISSSDRLGFTVFMAIALHLIVIMGIGFEALKTTNKPTTIEVTLAKFEHHKEPDDADFLAQMNQLGSGQPIEKAQQLTTTEQAKIQAPKVNKTSPTMEALQPSEVDQQEQEAVVATQAPQRLTTNKDSLPVPKPEQPKSAKRLLQRSLEIASLEAELDYQQKVLTRSPRIRTITTTSTKRASDAYYVKAWLDKVERIGNLNYPEKARQKGIFGDLRLLVSLLPNGALKEIRVLESSGHKVLDDAAIRIVRLAAPFAPFPDELAKDTDELEIIRTWRFQKNNVLSQY